VKLSKNRGNINFDLDFASSRSDLKNGEPQIHPVERSNYHSVSLLKNKLITTSKLSASRTMDVDVDKDAATLEKRYSEDLGMRFSNTSKLQLDGRLADCINANLAVDYSKQMSYTRSLVSGASPRLPIIWRMVPTKQFTCHRSTTQVCLSKVNLLNLFISADGRLHKQY